MTMVSRQGIVGWAAIAISLGCVGAWAQPGVTEKVGQTRVTPVPAPLPQAVPAGQGVRAVAPVARPSLGQPAPPESPLLPKPPSGPGTLLGAAPARPDVEVAPVAPSLAAHGLPVTATAAPAAADVRVPAAGEGPAKGPVKDATKGPQKGSAVKKPGRAASAASGDRPVPGKGEPRLRPDPAPLKGQPATHRADRLSHPKAAPTPQARKIAKRPAARKPGNVRRSSSARP